MADEKEIKRRVHKIKDPNEVTKVKKGIKRPKEIEVKPDNGLFYKSGRIRVLTGERNGYQAVLSYKTADGKWHEKTKMLKSETLSAAKKEMQAWWSDEEKKATMSPIEKMQEMAKTLKLSTYMSDFIEYKLNTQTVTLHTIDAYIQVAKHVKERFRNILIGQLDWHDVQDWYTYLLNVKKLSTSTVIRIHQFLKMVYDRALLEHIVIDNPINYVTPPKRKAVKQGINVIDKEDREKLINTLDNMTLTKITVATYIAYYTGLRRGEICALRWIDVNLENKTLWVKQSIGVSAKSSYIKDPKTHEIRQIALGDKLVEILKRWQKEQLIYEGEKQPYVIGHKGRYCHPSDITHGWGLLIRSLGIIGTEGRIPTFHDLRHTWATVAVAAGIDIKTVSGNLGHADAAMTLNTYAASDLNAKTAAAEKLNNIL